ncbi:hypothetical protein HZS_944 [Henneguya salminicola]|nr:hypothetical protein HZS_944 [Henneguya salminicola]
MFVLVKCKICMLMEHFASLAFCSLKSGFVVSVLCALFPNKEETAYKPIFQMIKNMWPTLKPISISADFELSLQNSIRFAMLNFRMFFFIL